MMFLQFNLGGSSYFGDHLMDLPMDGLMCGNAFIPAVHPLFPRLAPLARPHAGSQEMGGPTVAGDCFPQDGGGTGQAAMVLVFGQLQTARL